jgi:dTDP-4-amino-4,6-dideoxygalactose transaminase
VNYEERYAQWLGVEANRLVASSSGTTALDPAFFTSPAKEWHVPAWSFSATALAPPT